MDSSLLLVYHHLLMGLLVAVLLVGVRSEEVVELGRVLDLELDEPGLALGFGVDQSGLVGELLVDLDDGPGNGGVDVGCRLDGFDGTETIALVEVVSDFGEVDEDDVPQRGLGKVGDSASPDVPLDLDVLVGWCGWWRNFLLKTQRLKQQQLLLGGEKLIEETG